MTTNDPDRRPISEFVKDLTADARAGHLPPVHGRDGEVQAAFDAITAKQRRSVLLVGEPGVGKKAILGEVVRRIARNDCPETLRGRVVWEVQVSDFIAGGRWLGTWEDRVRDLIAACRTNRHLLWLDDVVSLFGAGNVSGSNYSAADLIFRAVRADDISVLSELTPDRLAAGRQLDGQRSLDLFWQVAVEPTTAKDTLAILQSVSADSPDLVGGRLTPETAQTVLDLTRRFEPYANYPGKAIRLLRDATEAYRDEGGVLEGERRLDGCGLLARVWFHAGTTRLLGLGHDGSARVWDWATGSAVGPALRHESAVVHAALSVDGRQVATASNDHTARIWNPLSGEELAVLTGHECPVTCVVFSPDGKSVVTGATDGTARRWDIKTRSQFLAPLEHGSEVIALALSPALSRWSRVGDWAAATFTAGFAPSRGGPKLVTAGRDDTICVWDIEKGGTLLKRLSHAQNATLRPVVSPDGWWLVMPGLSDTSGPVAGPRDQTWFIWNVARIAEGRPDHTLREAGLAEHAAFSPDSKRLVTGGPCGAQVWDVESSGRVGPLLNHPNVIAVAFSSDGRLVATVSDQAVRVWNAATGAPVTPPLKHFHSVCGVDFAADGRSLVTIDEYATVRTWGLSVSPAFLTRHYSRKTGIPEQMISDKIPLPLPEVERYLSERVIGQPEAVTAVVNLLAKIKAEMTPPGVPLGRFFFTGASGVGKTELARALAEYLFGSRDRMYRFDMGEYFDKGKFYELLGSHNQPHGKLAALRQQPFAVVLFDEIEKADPTVGQLLMGALGTGYFTDAANRRIDLRSSIIVLTSNLGSQEDRLFPLDSDNSEAMRRMREEHYRKSVRENFSDAFVGRLDMVVVFRSLDQAARVRITEREIKLALERRGISKRHIRVTYAPEVIDWIAQIGISPQFGARGLKACVESEIVIPFSRILVEKSNIEGKRFHVRLEGDKLHFGEGE